MGPRSFFATRSHASAVFLAGLCRRHCAKFLDDHPSCRALCKNKKQEGKAGSCQVGLFGFVGCSIKSLGSRATQL